MTEGERLKRRVQRPSLMTATGPGTGCVVVGWLDGAAESGLNAELLVEVSGDEFAGGQRRRDHRW